MIEQFDQDVHRQYTNAGPHHADVVFDSVLLKAKPCVYLMDDITVELDNKHVQHLFDAMSNVRGQFFLTSVHPLTCPGYLEGKVYRLEQGRCLDQAIS